MKLPSAVLSGKFWADPFILIITATHNIKIWRKQKNSKNFTFTILVA